MKVAYVVTEVGPGRAPDGTRIAFIKPIGYTRRWSGLPRGDLWSVGTDGSG